MKKNQMYRGLVYPFGKGWAPEFGKVKEVAKGVYWLSMLLPMRLARINLWLLEDGDGWTVVDTGLNYPECEQIWESVFERFFQDRSVNRVIVTHMHPDHIGLAGKLTKKYDCELWMSREEYIMCRILVSDTGKEAPPIALDYYRAAGMSQAELEIYKQRFGLFGKMVFTLPESYCRLQDRQTIVINGRYWQIVTGKGHSPEHVCLYCPALKLLISGDQVISRITPNVSVWPTEPEGDPLADWLHSCQKLVRLLPGDLLVLPAHQEPFYGLHTRLNQLIEGHTEALADLFEYLIEPRTAIDCFSILFKSEVGQDVKTIAIGEAIAHLNYLLHRKMIVRRPDSQGVDYYQQSPEMANTGGFSGAAIA